MFKIKWTELGAKLKRVFSTQKEMEAEVAKLRRDGIRADAVISPATVKRLKPKSKPPVAGGRGTAMIGDDGIEIKVGEKCFYRVYTGEWKRGTLECVKNTRHGGMFGWVEGKYLPWRMVGTAEIRSALVARAGVKSIALAKAA